MSWKAKAFAPLLAAVLLVLAQAPAYAQFNPPGVNPTHYWTYRLLDPVVIPQPIVVSASRSCGRSTVTRRR